MTYKVLFSKEVEQAIDDIYGYIANVLLSPQSAKNTIAKILDGLAELEQFPVVGFNMDEKVGVKINKEFVTRGKILEQYVILYFIDEENKIVYLSHLFHTKSDYVRIMKGRN